MPHRKHSVAATRSKTGRGSPRLAKRRREPPPHSTQVPATNSRIEPPPSTNVVHVTELTLDGDWVRRTPSAELILPPPPQFADLPTQTHRPPLPPLMPEDLPSRSHTAASAMRLARSRAAAPATRPTRPHTPEQDTPTPTRREANETQATYASVTSLQQHTTPTTIRPTNLNTGSPSPSHVIVKRFPNWIEHLTTISVALGYNANVRAHLAGAKFEPKTEEELQTVLRCLEEAAASDSSLSFTVVTPGPKPSGRKTPATQTRNIPTQQDATRPPATAAPRDAAPSTTISAAPATTDAAQAEATPTTAAPCARRRRRRRAPRPPRHPPVEPIPARTQQPRRPALLPTVAAQSSLDYTVWVIVKALTTGIAAYLREKGTMR